MSRDGRLDLPGKVAYEGQEESNCTLIFTEKVILLVISVRRFYPKCSQKKQMIKFLLKFIINW